MTVCEANLASKITLQVWHEQLGHQSKRYVFLKQRKIDVADDDEFCRACVLGKQQRSSFQSRQQRAIEPGDIIHADLCGHMECTSLGGVKYFACFKKSKTFDKIAEVLQIIKNNCTHPMKAFQCDGGREFNNFKVEKLMKSMGIQFIVTNPYTPEQTGCAKRTNRTVDELARSMLLAKNLPKSLWAEALNTAMYMLNRTGPSSVDGKTPYEVFTGNTTHLVSRIWN